MNIYSYEEAFGAADKTSRAMRRAIADWYDLYFRDSWQQDRDPGQRIAYTVVNKLVKTIFGEYKAQVQGKQEQMAVAALDGKCREAMQQTLVGGECYLKPWFDDGVPCFGVIPRRNVLIFGRNGDGEPTDLGTVEKTVRDRYYYTLLERRFLDPEGYTVIENRLFRSLNDETLGVETELGEVKAYAELPRRYRYSEKLGSVGLVRMKNPMLNCVDGSADGVSVYAAAARLIRSIDENEAQMAGEFRRGESRIIASADMLTGDKLLQDHLFVGLDEDPQSVGITVFSPQLREQSFLNRKKEYLRNVESIIGLKRGALSDSNVEQKTATEIASSAGDYNLTIIDFQKMWERALVQAVQLCQMLARAQGYEVGAGQLPAVDWGNGVLYDEDKTWADYMGMVASGLLKPELALAWRFGLPAETEADLQVIRKKYMPKTEEKT